MKWNANQRQNIVKAAELFRLSPISVALAIFNISFFPREL